MNLNENCIHFQMIHIHISFLFELVKECLGQAAGDQASARIEADQH